MRKYKPLFIALDALCVVLGVAILVSIPRGQRADDPLTYAIIALQAVIIAGEVFLNFKSTDSRKRHIVSVVVGIVGAAAHAAGNAMVDFGSTAFIFIGLVPYTMWVVAFLGLRIIGKRKFNSRDDYSKQ